MSLARDLSIIPLKIWRWAWGGLGILFVSACGGGGARTAPSGNYQEYECPAPIGRIVREDCGKIALKYEGTRAEGTLGVQGVGVSGHYQTEAIREADQLVSVLKEQRVGLCNDFNTCKLTVVEYRSDKRALDDSYLALMTIQEKLQGVSADDAVKLLREVRKIRGGVTGEVVPDPEQATPASGTEPSAGSAQPAPDSEPATAALSASPQEEKPKEDEFSCRGFTLQVARRGPLAGKSYQYPLTRKLLRGHSEYAQVRFFEFLLTKETLSGKEEEFLVVADAPDIAVQDQLRAKLRELNPGAAQDISCPEIRPVRELSLVDLAD